MKTPTDAAQPPAAPRLPEARSLTTAQPDMKEKGTLGDPSPYMTVPELAAWLGVSRYSIYMAVRRDGLPCRRFGGRLYFRKAEVEAFLDARKVSRRRHGHHED